MIDIIEVEGKQENLIRFQDALKEKKTSNMTYINSLKYVLSNEVYQIITTKYFSILKMINRFLEFIQYDTVSKSREKYKSK